MQQHFKKSCISIKQRLLLASSSHQQTVSKVKYRNPNYSSSHCSVHRHANVLCVAGFQQSALHVTRLQHVMYFCCTGYLVSCSTSNVTLAMGIAPVLLVPFMLFGGFFLNAG